MGWWMCPECNTRNALGCNVCDHCGYQKNNGKTKATPTTTSKTYSNIIIDVVKRIDYLKRKLNSSSMSNKRQSWNAELQKLNELKTILDEHRSNGSLVIQKQKDYL